MKKKPFTAIFAVIAVMALPVLAQMMPKCDLAVQSSETAKEEAEGKAVWEKLQTGNARCEYLSEDDFELLGEYFMGQWAGDSHEAMNQMMVRMMGEKGERQMHISLGKRQSGCDPNAQLLAGGEGFMPMAGMMQNFGGCWVGFITSLLLSSLLVVAVIVFVVILVHWLMKTMR